MALLICAPCVGRAAHTDTGNRGPTCGPGTIAFRASVVGEKRFMCQEGSWYDGGSREYIAHLSQPVDATRVTLVLVHRQASYNAGAGGVLHTKEVRVTNTRATSLRGTIDFSGVYFVSGPAGAPPFGTYTLSIYRGPGAPARLLARGQFTVIED